MYNINRLEHNTPKDLIEEYLAKGGKITICPPGEKTENMEYTSGFYGGRRKKATEPTVEVDIEEE